ncbi:MAG: hypothetical protein G01um10145_797 [Microgenomates group bacterium Gr01-1014_5]|nr:MAG: hypothetical protein G01um10145_797 [Microgenomates group bacterium Gr01-1014_5]
MSKEAAERIRHALSDAQTDAETKRVLEENRASVEKSRLAAEEEARIKLLTQQNKQNLVATGVVDLFEALIASRAVTLHKSYTATIQEKIPTLLFGIPIGNVRTTKEEKHEGRAEIQWGVRNQFITLRFDERTYYDFHYEHGESSITYYSTLTANINDQDGTLWINKQEVKDLSKLEQVVQDEIFMLKGLPKK